MNHADRTFLLLCLVSTCNVTNAFCHPACQPKRLAFAKATAGQREGLEFISGSISLLRIEWMLKRVQHDKNNESLMNFAGDEIFSKQLVSTSAANCIIEETESIKTMNQKETIKNSGQFTAIDKQGSPVIIEWQKTTLFAPAFASAMKDVWDLARGAYTPVEMNFLRAYPEVVGSEDYFKPFEPLFAKGLAHVDWAATEEVMQALLKSHFIFDASTWGPEVLAAYGKDVCYVVTVKDQQTKVLCGFITFMIRQNYVEGDVKVMSFAIDQAYQKRGLGKLLMSSIFTIKPDIKRIFLCTRVTNKTALAAYHTWGFTIDANPILDHAFNLKHWVFLEYKTTQSGVLETVAAELKEVK